MSIRLALPQHCETARAEAMVIGRVLLASHWPRSRVRGGRDIVAVRSTSMTARSRASIRRRAPCLHGDSLCRHRPIIAAGNRLRLSCLGQRATATSPGPACMQPASPLPSMMKTSLIKTKIVTLVDPCERRRRRATGHGLDSRWWTSDRVWRSRFELTKVVLVTINYRLGPFGFLLILRLPPKRAALG